MRKTDAGPSNAVSETKHVLNVKSSFFDCNCNCNHRQLSFVVGRPNVSATDASAVNAIAFGCETRKRVLASPDRSRHPPTFSLYTRLKRHPAGRTKGIGLQDLHSFTSRPPQIRRHRRPTQRSRTKLLCGSSSFYIREGDLRLPPCR